MKYVYGVLFAACVGIAVWLILLNYVESVAAIAAGVMIGVLVSPLCVKHMNKDGVRENMLPDEESND